MVGAIMIVVGHWAADDDGGFVIAWQGRGSGDTDGIFARRYDRAGLPQGGEFRVNTYTPSGQYVPSVAMDGDSLAATTRAAERAIRSRIF
jgi:hypothetical protein